MRWWKLRIQRGKDRESKIYLDDTLLYTTELLTEKTFQPKLLKKDDRLVERKVSSIRDSVGGIKNERASFAY